MPGWWRTGIARCGGELLLIVSEHPEHIVLPLVGHWSPDIQNGWSAVSKAPQDSRIRLDALEGLQIQEHGQHTAIRGPVLLQLKTVIA